MAGKDYSSLKSKTDISTILKSIVNRVEDLELKKSNPESVDGLISVSDTIHSNIVEEIHIPTEDNFSMSHAMYGSGLDGAGSFIDGYVEITDGGGLLYDIPVTRGKLNRDLNIGDKVVLISNNSNRFSKVCIVSSVSSSGFVVYNPVSLSNGTHRILKVQQGEEYPNGLWGSFSYMIVPTSTASLISVGSEVTHTNYSGIGVLQEPEVNKLYGIYTEDTNLPSTGVSQYNNTIIRNTLSRNGGSLIERTNHNRNGSYFSNIPPSLGEGLYYSVFDDTRHKPHLITITEESSTYSESIFTNSVGTIYTGDKIAFVKRENINNRYYPVDYDEYRTAISVSGGNVVFNLSISPGEYFIHIFDTEITDTVGYSKVIAKNYNHQFAPPINEEDEELLMEDGQVFIIEDGETFILENALVLIHTLNTEDDEIITTEEGEDIMLEESAGYITPEDGGLYVGLVLSHPLVFSYNRDNTNFLVFSKT